MIAKLKRLESQLPDRFGQALYREAEVVATAAKKVTPWKSGELRGTIRVEKPVRDGRHISVAIVAGGPTVAYAHRVHEDLEARHKDGTYAKFIERPIHEAMTGMNDRLAHRINTGE